MKILSHFLLLGIFSLSIATLALAQTQDTAAEDSTEEAAESDSQIVDSESTSEPLEPVPELPPLEAVLGTDDEAGPEDSPDRFIPTEQISQDSGVSFPSDI